MYYICIEESSNINSNTMKFQKVKKALLNSEGDILAVVERTDDPDQEQLYVAGLVFQSRAKIYCKTNVDQIELFLLGRCSVSELFKLRSDEPYIIEVNHHQEKVYYDEAFESKILISLQCGNYHFFQLPQSMRIDDTFEFIRILKRDYIHSYASVPISEEQFSTEAFFSKYPELKNRHNPIEPCQ